jgi:sortase A
LSSSPSTSERWLLFTGVSLCLIYVGGLAYHAVSSRLTVRVFRHSNTISEPEIQNAGAVNANLTVDYRLWSAERIAAYQDSLARQFEPPIAVLRVPKLGLQAPVFDGTDELVLNRGIGRIVGTAQLGEPGNIAITGHRDGFFRALKNIAIGDSLILDTSGETASYVVEKISVVDPEDISVLAPTPTRALTLVTCYPFYYVGEAPHRYIVQCSLDKIASTGRNGDLRR